MLASEAVLILFVQSRKISTVVLFVKAAQAELVLCVHGPKISTAVLIVQATTCAKCSSLASFARTLDKN